MDATIVDLTPVLDIAVKLMSLVVAGLAVPMTMRAVAVVEKRFNLTLTAQQQQTVHEAAGTAAGAVANLLSRNLMGIHDVHIDNPYVRQLAAQALNAVPQAAASFGLTVPDVAHMIVGKVGTLLALDPTTVTVPPPAAPAVVLVSPQEKAA